MEKILNIDFLKDKKFWPFVILGPAFVLLYRLLGLAKSHVWASNDINLFFQVTLVAAIIEELIFRGLIYEILQKTASLKNKKVWALTVINLITSLCFMAAHFLHHSTFWALVVLIPSLIFGKMKEKYGTVLAPIFLHFTYNLSYFLFFE